MGAPVIVAQQLSSPKLKYLKVLKTHACRASMSEIWLKNDKLFSDLQAFNFSVKFWRKTMRICVNRVTPLQKHPRLESFLFFVIVVSASFFKAEIETKRRSLFLPIIWQQRKFSLNLAALLCFAWVARIPCLSRSHRHQLQHNYKQTFDCEAKVTDVLKIVERLGKMKIYLPNFSFLMPHLSLKNLSFYSSPLNQLSLGLFITRGPPERDINWNEI